MLYDLSRAIDNERLQSRIEAARKKGEVVEFKVKRPLRSLPQNRYLHLILGWFACETGNTLNYVKLNYFKLHCNQEIFCVPKHDTILGEMTMYVKSSSELDTAQMTTAIDRFRDWASSEGGIYLPAPDEEAMLREIEVEISRQERYL